MLSLPTLFAAVGLISSLGASAVPTPTDAAVEAVPTLVSGYSFIRAVVSTTAFEYHINRRLNTTLGIHRPHPTSTSTFSRRSLVQLQAQFWDLLRMLPSLKSLLES